MFEMTKLRVLVLKENDVWVAQAIEQDLATQVAHDETALDAVTALGDIFDLRDATVRKYAHENITFAPLPVTPSSYHRLWEEGTPLGEHPLGSTRMAEVRSCSRR